MFKKLRNMKDEKGFTLVELLVVIVIIGILFAVLLPRIDFAGDSARETGVQTDFRSFQLASEQQFRLSPGGTSPEAINRYLDNIMKFEENVDGVYVSGQEDPWGLGYALNVDTFTEDGEEYPRAVFASFGKERSAIPAVWEEPEMGMVTTTYDGAPVSCSFGLGSNIELTESTYDSFGFTEPYGDSLTACKTLGGF